MTFYSGVLALGTGTNSFVEQTGTGYSRQSVTFSQAVAGSNRRIVNSAVTFTAGGNWSDVSTQLAIFPYPDSSSEPLVWWNADISIPALADDATATIAAGQISWMLSDVAAASGITTKWNVGDNIGVTAGNNALKAGAPIEIDDGSLSLGFPTGVIAHLKSANTNVTTDQRFIISPLVTGNWIPTKIICTNCTVSLTAALGGIYSAASKGGTAIVAASQAYTSLTGTATQVLVLTLSAAGQDTLISGAPYLSLSTPQGSAATMDCYILGVPVF